MASDEAVKAARAWLQHAHGEDTCPVSDTDDALCLAEVLDRFAAKARLERTMNDWNEVKVVLPAENQVVETKIDDEHGLRNQQKLKRQGGLWFFPNESMYVYYTPTHWRWASNDDWAERMTSNDHT